MNEQDFLVHLDINKFDINQESLVKEVLNQNYLKYSNFFNKKIHSMDETVKWLMEVEDWQACDIDLENNQECKKFYTQIKKLLDVDFLEVTTCRSLYQKANQELIPTGPFMQYTATCTDPGLPAIIHGDGTSRVQTVSADQSVGFRKLLERWYEETGCPILLNTSLNIKGKPIVNTVEDAQAFEQHYGVKVCTAAAKT